MFRSKQPRKLKASLTDCSAARMIAVLVAGSLINAMQVNLTHLGVAKYGKLYSNAVVRVIVEKQLGTKGRLTDYNALIKSLATTQINKDKVLYQLLDILIRSVQMGNHYTRTLDRQNIL